eukprot:359062-Chlamydomonas_euryale.AAC.24
MPGAPSSGSPAPPHLLTPCMPHSLAEQARPVLRLLAAAHPEVQLPAQPRYPAMACRCRPAHLGVQCQLSAACQLQDAVSRPPLRR